MSKQINYYGTEDSYIHLKFGQARKCFFFTNEFKKKYPEFCQSYERYFWGEYDENNDNDFGSAFEVVENAKALKLPANLFYFNFIDTPANSYEEIENYLENQN